MFMITANYLSSLKLAASLDVITPIRNRAYYSLDKGRSEI
jgi:hypothetical protein